MPDQNKMHTFQPTIWNTIEIDCISRDWDYEQYIEAHERLHCRGAVCTREMYNELWRAFNNEMDRAFNVPLRSSTDRMNVS